MSMRIRYLLPLFIGLIGFACTKQDGPPDYSQAADFTYTGTLQNAKPIKFVSTSQYAKSYSWDFGDGTKKNTDAQPTHTFYQAGTYPVTLAVASAGGAITQTQKLVLAQIDTVSPIINTLIGRYHFTKVQSTTNNYGTGSTTTTKECDINAAISQSGLQLSFSLEYGTLPLLSTSKPGNYTFGRNYNPYAYLFFKYGTDSLVYTAASSSLGGSHRNVYFGKKQ